MYTDKEISKIQAEFWTTFGLYMRPVPGVYGERVNWINYKTNIKYLSFNLNFTDKVATLIIKISHPNFEDQNSFLKTFKVLKNELNSFPQPLIFAESSLDSNSSTINCILGNVNIFNKETWPAAISFLKEVMIELDVFWQNHKDVFEML